MILTIFLENNYKIISRNFAVLPWFPLSSHDYSGIVLPSHQSWRLGFISDMGQGQSWLQACCAIQHQDLYATNHEHFLPKRRPSSILAPINRNQGLYCGRRGYVDYDGQWSQLPWRLTWATNHSIAIQLENTKQVLWNYGNASYAATLTWQTFLYNMLSLMIVVLKKSYHLRSMWVSNIESFVMTKLLCQ